MGESSFSLQTLTEYFLLGYHYSKTIKIRRSCHIVKVKYISNSQLLWHLLAGPGATKLRDMTTVRNFHDGIFLCAVKVRCEDGNKKKDRKEASW